MLVSPINRSRRSDNLASCATAPRQRRGQRNGRMPSRTSKRQNAMPNSCHMIPTDAKKPGFPRLPNHTTLIATSHKPQATSFKLQAKSDAYLQLMACSLTLPLGLGLFQITEEVTARIEHQHITLIRAALPPGGRHQPATRGADDRHRHEYLRPVPYPWPDARAPHAHARNSCDRT